MKSTLRKILQGLTKADNYEEFLDIYLEIVPGGAFGLYKEDLLPDEDLKRFLGY